MKNKPILKIPSEFDRIYYAEVNPPTAAPPHPWRWRLKPKQVHQFDLNGNYLMTFPSLSAAARFLDAHQSNITTAVKTKSTCKGFYWSCTINKELTTQ